MHTGDYKIHLTSRIKKLEGNYNKESCLVLLLFCSIEMTIRNPPITGLSCRNPTYKFQNLNKEENKRKWNPTISSFLCFSLLFTISIARTIQPGTNLSASNQPNMVFTNQHILHRIFSSGFIFFFNHQLHWWYPNLDSRQHHHHGWLEGILSIPILLQPPPPQRLWNLCLKLKHC